MSKRPTVPAEMRATYEKTDQALYELSGLLVALDLLIEHYVPDSADLRRNAVSVMIQESQGKLDKITDLRGAEWRSIGGNTEK